MSVKKKKKKPLLFERKPKGDFLTVKTSLKSILKDYPKNFQTINQLVSDCHQIVAKTYQFIRLFILHKFHRGEEIPSLDTKIILYFVRACGVRDNRGVKAQNSKLAEELNAFYEKEFSPCLNGSPKFSLKNKTYLTPYLAQQIQTAFYNNLKEHFLTRIRRFMNIVRPEETVNTEGEGTEFNQVKNTILRGDEEGLRNIPEKYQEWSQWIRNNFLPPKFEKCYGYDVKVNPDKYLFYTIKINAEIEWLNEEVKNDQRLTDEERRCRIKKLFQPIPLRNSLVPSYITLDTNCILSLFKEKGESQLGKKTGKNKAHIWQKIFKTGKKVMNLRGYEYKTIQTDGVSVSICFQKIRKERTSSAISGGDSEQTPYIDELSDEELNTGKEKHLVGVDPGKANIVFMVDKNGKKLRYTLRQKQRETLRKRSERILLREKERNGIIEVETELSSLNCKTIDYDKFKKFIKKKAEMDKNIAPFYERVLFRKMKWRTQIYQRKSEDNFMNKIEETYGKRENILLCYGNWSNKKQMKYIMPTKGVGMRRLLEKKFPVSLIDEFKTSKICSKCGGELTNYKRFHRVLVCNGCEGNSLGESGGSENKKTIFINRDVNACMNMLRIGESWITYKIRPNIFNRGTRTDPDCSFEEKSSSGEEKTGVDRLFLPEGHASNLSL